MGKLVGLALLSTLKFIPIYLLSLLIGKITFRYIIPKKKKTDEISNRFLFSLVLTIVYVITFSALITNVSFFSEWFDYEEANQNLLVAQMVFFSILHLLYMWIISAFTTFYKPQNKE
jgi:hypothetical protein